MVVELPMVEGTGCRIEVSFDAFGETVVIVELCVMMLLLEQLHYARNVEERFPFFVLFEGCWLCRMGWTP